MWVDQTGHGGHGWHVPSLTRAQGGGQTVISCRVPFLLRNGSPFASLPQGFSLFYFKSLMQILTTLILSLGGTGLCHPTDH